jgi:hypothetical protein
VIKNQARAVRDVKGFFAGFAVFAFNRRELDRSVIPCFL